MKAGASIVALIIDFVFNAIGKFVDMMLDPVIEDGLSFNFLYALLFVWICWQAVSLFLLRPSPLGSITDDVHRTGVRIRSSYQRSKAAQAAEARQREAEARQREAEAKRLRPSVRTTYRRNKSGAYTKVHSTTTVKDADGNVSVYEN